MRKPQCLQCSRYCKPNYEVMCTVCNHPRFKHAYYDNGGTRETCSHNGSAPCTCTVRSYMNRRQAEFKQTLMGYGINRTGLFCTLRCAADWALEHAPQYNAALNDREAWFKKVTT